MPAHHLVLYGNMCLNTNKLKIHPWGIAIFKKKFTEALPKEENYFVVQTSDHACL